jgi:HEAT repeat protein
VTEQRLNDWPEWPIDPIAILEVLERHQVRYVVIGGLAAVIHGSPLPTYDIDITPERTKANLRALLAALAELDALALAEDDDERAAADLLEACDDLSFFTPSGYLDVVFSPAGSRGYGGLASRAQRLDVADGVAPQVADLRAVIHSKHVLGRTRDQAHMTALLTLLEMRTAVRT